MRTIVLATQKGGSGKSTLFRALAVARPDWPVPAGYGE